ncbi:HotDog domain-containing protein [Boletus edulis]|nr:HotDog domain-containing protein [Boletus edulis]
MKVKYRRNLPAVFLGMHPSKSKLVQRWLNVMTTHGFGTRSVQHMELVEVSIVPNVDEPTRQEARVVLEMTVTQDTTNSSGKMHGACIVHLVDICTTLPTAAMSFASGGSGSVGVSQSINVVYHAPASLGDKLRLINTSTAMGTRTWNGRIEIWDVTHHRLVASGTQVKMEASSSSSTSKL